MLLKKRLKTRSTKHVTHILGNDNENFKVMLLESQPEPPSTDLQHLKALCKSVSVTLVHLPPQTAGFSHRNREMGF